MHVVLESFAARITELLSKLLLPVHAAEKIGVSRVRAQRIEQFILADSQHNPMDSTGVAIFR
jgi:hypothetical protein